MASTNFRATDELLDSVRKTAEGGGISVNQALITLVRLGLRKVDDEYEGDILIARRDLNRPRPRPARNDSGERS